MELLGRDNARVDAELEKTEAQREACESQMEQLKVALYAKFGKENISESAVRAERGAGA